MSVDGGTPLTRVNPTPGSPAVRGVGDRRGQHRGEERHEEPPEQDQEVEETPAVEDQDSEDEEHLDITA
jgi:hypothetical protein